MKLPFRGFFLILALLFTPIGADGQQNQECFVYYGASLNNLGEVEVNPAPTIPIVLVLDGNQGRQCIPSLFEDRATFTPGSGGVTGDSTLSSVTGAWTFTIINPPEPADTWYREWVVRDGETGDMSRSATTNAALAVINQAFGDDGCGTIGVYRVAYRKVGVAATAVQVDAVTLRATPPTGTPLTPLCRPIAP